MAKHYSHNGMGKMGSKKMGSKKMMKGKRHKMMLPRDSAGGGYGDDTQMYHQGPRYYGPGYGQIANMPTYADLHFYPKGKSYLMTDKYPDTIREIDSESNINMNNLKRQPSKSKY